MSSLFDRGLCDSFQRPVFFDYRLRDDTELELDPDHFEDGTTEQPTLRIKNATRYDQGVYICILENDVGSAQSDNAIYVNISCGLLLYGRK